LLNQTLNALRRIPQQADIEKRQVDKNIIASNSDLYKIFFIRPNGDMYSEESYSEKQASSAYNFAFHDYFRGAFKINDTYLGKVVPTIGASGIRGAVIAVPVYSLKDNSTIVGVLGGGINLDILNKELQSFNLTSLDDNTCIIYVKSNGLIGY
jgi:C4-dicarboxylate-specific signal transduction histidine kinase